VIDTAFLKDGYEKIALIIRHADREHIHAGVHDIEMPINELGEKNAKQIGTSLWQFENMKIITSPVYRCVQTGNAIIDGFGKQSQISQSNLLGEPGPFVVDGKLAKEYFVDLGCYRTVKMQIENQIMKGIRPTKEGSELLTKFVIDEMKNNTLSNLSVFVSHDAILAPFIFYHTGEMFDKEHWISFLDGVAFVEKNGKFYIVRNGKQYELR
jgi:hypothetical protein